MLNTIVIYFPGIFDNIMMSDNHLKISGEWEAHTVHGGSCGYEGVLEITENGNDIIIEEVSGSRFCFCIPRGPEIPGGPHSMMKVSPNQWQNTRVFSKKYMSITRISNTELKLLTLRGCWTLTR